VGDELWLWLGRVADVVSLLTLPVTVWAAWGVSRLKRRLAFRADSSRLVADLDTAVAMINASLQATPEDHRQVEVQVAAIVAMLDYRSGALSRPIRARQKKLERLVQELGQASGSGRLDHASDLAWKCYSEAVGAIMQFRMLARDGTVGADDA
jgi:hypothetical protein